MNYETISKTFSKEDECAKINNIPADFFREAAECIRELEDECQNCGLRSREGKMIKDMIDRAASDVKGIHMMRVRKVMSRATSQAYARNDRPVSTDLENMLPEERELYERVLAGIKGTGEVQIGAVLG